jgi:ferritin
MMIPKKIKTGTPVSGEAEVKDEVEASEPSKGSIASMINAQINKEQYSILVYEALASWADYNDYIGASKWLYKKGSEESNHKAKFMAYVNDRGWKVEIKGNDTPDVGGVDSIESVLKMALSHEKTVTKSISAIQDACEEEGDRLTYNFLDWFLVEQIEEEAVLMDALSFVKLASDQALVDNYFKTI